MSVPHLGVEHVAAVLAVAQLLRRSASRYKEQQVGCVCDLQIVGLISTAQDGSLILIPSNH